MFTYKGVFMVVRSFKVLGLSLAVLTLVACSTSKKEEVGFTDSADSALKLTKSDVCKGKINNKGIQKLADFVSDPPAFFCIANYRMVAAIVKEKEALGQTQEAAKAKQVLERLENGTAGPEASKVLMVSLSPTDKQKSSEQEALLNVSNEKQQAAVLESRREFGAAVNEAGIGVAALLVQIKVSVDTAKKLKENKGFNLSETAQIKKTVESVLQSASMLLTLKETVDIYEKNHEHIRKEGEAAMYNKSSFDGAAAINDLAPSSLLMP
jgi:hypothetical protein